MQESVTADATERRSSEWSRATRVLFRFTFTYFALFALPNIEEFVPGMSWIAHPVDGAWCRVPPFVGRNLIAIEETISVSELSTGDRATDYIAFLCVVGVACLVAALWWSIFGRRARAYPRLQPSLA